MPSLRKRRSDNKKREMSLTGFGNKIGKSSEDDVNSKKSNRSTKTERTSNKRSDSKMKASSNLKRVDESTISESTRSATSLAKETMGTTKSGIESIQIASATDSSSTDKLRSVESVSSCSSSSKSCSSVETDQEEDDKENTKIKQLKKPPKSPKIKSTGNTSSSSAAGLSERVSSIAYSTVSNADDADTDTETSGSGGSDTTDSASDSTDTDTDTDTDDSRRRRRSRHHIDDKRIKRSMRKALKEVLLENQKCAIARERSIDERRLKKKLKESLLGDRNSSIDSRSTIGSDWRGRSPSRSRSEFSNYRTRSGLDRIYDDDTDTDGSDADTAASSTILSYGTASYDDETVGSDTNSTSSFSQGRDEVDYDKRPTQLFYFLENRLWVKAASRCREYKNESKVWVYRLGKTGKLMWRMQPIHIAMLYKAPSFVVLDILAANPKGPSIFDDRMMLPIHMACRVVCKQDTLRILLTHYPEGLNAEDGKGRTPLDHLKKAEDERAREKCGDVHKLMDVLQEYEDMAENGDSTDGGDTDGDDDTLVGDLNEKGTCSLWPTEW